MYIVLYVLEYAAADVVPELHLSLQLVLLRSEVLRYLRLRTVRTIDFPSALFKHLVSDVPAFHLLHLNTHTASTRSGASCLAARDGVKQTTGRSWRRRLRSFHWVRTSFAVDH
jgi:hypothetical protein